MKRKKVSITKAIESARNSVAGWKEQEQRGRAFGMSTIHQKIVDELEDFRKDFKKHGKSQNYGCKTVSGYVDWLQNILFHAKFILEPNVNAEKITEVKKRLNKLYNKLVILIHLLKDIDIEE